MKNALDDHDGVIDGETSAEMAELDRCCFGMVSFKRPTPVPNSTKVHYRNAAERPLNGLLYTH